MPLLAFGLGLAAEFGAFAALAEELRGGALSATPRPARLAAAFAAAVAGRAGGRRPAAALAVADDLAVTEARDLAAPFLCLVSLAMQSLSGESACATGAASDTLASGRAGPIRQDKLTEGLKNGKREAGSVFEPNHPSPTRAADTSPW